MPSKRNSRLYVASRRVCRSVRRSERMPGALRGVAQLPLLAAPATLLPSSDTALPLPRSGTGPVSPAGGRTNGGEGGVVGLPGVPPAGGSRVSEQSVMGWR